MSTSIENRLSLRAASNPRGEDAALMLEAAKELARLRSAVVACDKGFAYKAGFYEGTLMGIVHRPHWEWRTVIEQALGRFGDEK